MLLHRILLTVILIPDEWLLMCVPVAQRAQLVHNDADAPDVALLCQHVLVEEFGGGLAG